MATITIDYESDGDVELILLTEADKGFPDQETSTSRLSDEEEKQTKHNIGPLKIHVKQFRLRVSSVKLISSSRYFQAMLEGPGFAEGRELNERGHVEIELTNPEDKPSVMMIILAILYGSDVEVPEKIDFMTLYNVTVLVDKYQWHQLVTPHAVLWFEALVRTQGLPIVFGDTLLAWLWMAWIFGLKDHFKTLSKVAQQDASYSLDLEDETIRLPNRVLQAINKRRVTAFQSIEQALVAFKDQILAKNLKDDDNATHRMCGCMALGFADLCSRNFKLGRFAVPDYAGQSVRSLRININLHTSSTGFGVRAGTSTDGKSISAGGGWDLKHKLLGVIDDLKMEDWGLEYNDFKR